MADSYSEFESIFAALHQDVKTCINMLAKEESLAESEVQFWRRSFIRAAFAFIEGSTYQLKQLALEYSKRLPERFSEAELAFLKEEDYDVTEKGDVVLTKAKVPLTKSIRLAFKSYAQAVSSDYEFKVDTQYWEAIKNSIRVRDRLMHPKLIPDVLVTKEEYLKALEALTWFNLSALLCILSAPGLEADLAETMKELRKYVQ